MTGLFRFVSLSFVLSVWGTTAAAVEATDQVLLCKEQVADRTEGNKTDVEGELVRRCVESGAASQRDYVSRGNLLLAGNDLAKALTAFEKALELNEADTAAKTGRAIVFARQGKLDEAEQLLRQQLALTPDPARIYLELGRIHEQRGDHVKALAVFREGIRVHEQGRR